MDINEILSASYPKAILTRIEQMEGNYISLCFVLDGKETKAIVSDGLLYALIFEVMKHAKTIQHALRV